MKNPTETIPLRGFTALTWLISKNQLRWFGKDIDIIKWYLASKRGLNVKFINDETVYKKVFEVVYKYYMKFNPKYFMQHFLDSRFPISFATSNLSLTEEIKTLISLLSSIQVYKNEILLFDMWDNDVFQDVTLGYIQNEFTHADFDKFDEYAKKSWLKCMCLGLSKIYSE